MTIDEPGYFERLARVEAGHWWSRAMWRLASDWLDEAIRGRRGLAALDVGCGAGLVADPPGGSPRDRPGRRPRARPRGASGWPGGIGGSRSSQGSALDLPFDDGSLRRGDLLRRLPAPARGRRPGRGVARSPGCSDRAAWRSSGRTRRGSGRGGRSGGSAYRLGELVEVLDGCGLERSAGLRMRTACPAWPRKSGAGSGSWRAGEVGRGGPILRAAGCGSTCRRRGSTG